ncbi:MAG: tRNA pseudouridine(55) synthase TruB [Balneolales bacterium]|nr:tRNA pseudouridine(55) synthase TruB [Balneolales bacterium]
MDIPKKQPAKLDSYPIIDSNTNPELLDAIKEKSIDFSSGVVFLVDKPKGWSSFRAVGLIRKLIGIKKVGHAGTLDPMATGLLVICCGKATKSVSLAQELHKEYIAGIRFGSSTPSYDAETEPDEIAAFEHITPETIEQTLKLRFCGDIEQVPPMYSALKVGGKRLYQLARKGVEIERKKRKITVYNTELLHFEKQKESSSGSVRIGCSKGTYIRSIAHDLGILLDSRAHLDALRRTSIGNYLAENALTPEQLITLFDADDSINLH